MSLGLYRRTEIDRTLRAGRWRRWSGPALLLSLALGHRVATVSATPTKITTVWAKGDVLTAEALNRNFQDVRGAIDDNALAIQRLTSPDCPLGYERDERPSEFVVCTRGADQVVRVGEGGAAFWIDRYEASVWNHRDTPDVQYGKVEDVAYPSTFPINGQYTSPLFALSVAHTLPSVSITWYQADAACEAAGKRLPNRVEWLRAARGTLDPGDSLGSEGTCITRGETRRESANATNCVSRWGAEDMIGNVWEWTDEWFGSMSSYENWESAANGRSRMPEFNDDASNGFSSAATEVGFRLTANIPSAALRGGSAYDGASAGVFSLETRNAPAFSNRLVGFRCVTSR